MSDNTNNKNRKIILLIIAILLIACGGAVFGYHLYTDYRAQKNDNEISSIVSTTQETTEGTTKERTVKNPIDFKSLQKKNSDIYAWIKVKGTKVDYPVVQSPESDEFYLKHSALDKSWIASGAIYTELVNSTDFTDRVTLIYGHNGYSDTMFTTLHKFEQQSFFDEHKTFVIYTPKSKLTYKIVSAFKYDDRHIMNSFDFQSDDIYTEFLEMIQNPSSSNKKVRTDLGRKLTKEDKIVVLSTCITNQPSSRYLVCGVLEKNEKTD